MAYEKSEREQEHIARSVALNNAVLTVNAVLARIDKPINTEQAGQRAKAVAEEYFKFLYAAPTSAASPRPAATGKPNPTGTVKPGGKGATQKGKGQQAPAKSLEDLNPDSVQFTLHSELAAACMGDSEEMERLMKICSEYKGYSKTVAEIAELSDGRAGSTLKKLRAHLEGNPPAQTAGQAAAKDDDIPF